ncbi:CxxH/CxxC protein [Alkalicoccus luteus]|uniref:CxxH/CxxC protein n=1 Tax=Alkalicoccus luteus TaxID=1237094 RepID=A0A969PUW4_9BACI|nr:CxxH/CxxC protein [Alkalicoccus luteus]NJP37954.1 CxxH/CxxC protein [Alkalicoccus luteus]
MVYSCKEHVEEALDETLTDGGPPPVLTETDREEAHCFICGKPALFQVET